VALPCSEVLASGRRYGACCRSAIRGAGPLGAESERTLLPTQLGCQDLPDATDATDATGCDKDATDLPDAGVRRRQAVRRLGGQQRRYRAQSSCGHACLQLQDRGFVEFVRARCRSRPSCDALMRVMPFSCGLWPRFHFGDFLRGSPPVLAVHKLLRCSENCAKSSDSRTNRNSR